MAAALIFYVLKESGVIDSDAVSGFVSEYRISVSRDGSSYKVCKEGTARVFGCEEIFCFDETKTRYVKFETLSTTGKASGWKIYENAKLKIAELSVFTMCKKNRKDEIF